MNNNNNKHNYAIEFRYPSWKTEGPWEMLKHYNIAAVITDSPAKENLQFLSDAVRRLEMRALKHAGKYLSRQRLSQNIPY